MSDTGTGRDFGPQQPMYQHHSPYQSPMYYGSPVAGSPYVGAGSPMNMPMPPPPMALAATPPSWPAQSMEDLMMRVQRQVEFYLSDTHLNADAFVRAKVLADPQGWVSVVWLALLPRLAELTSDVSLITTAITMSDLLEVSADGQLVRRVEAYDPDHTGARARSRSRGQSIGNGAEGNGRNGNGNGSDDINDEINERTLYVGNLDANSTVESVQQFFNSYGLVESVTMTRPIATQGQQPKQSKQQRAAFIVFDSEDQAEAAVSRLETEADAGMHSLLGMLKTEYIVQTKYERSKKPKQNTRDPMNWRNSVGTSTASAAASATAASVGAAAAAEEMSEEEKARRKAKLYAFEQTDATGAPDKIRQRRKLVTKRTTRTAKGPDSANAKGFTNHPANNKQ
eukprot:TRINITY_DN66973_c6_g6_i1.p1 TRINITY_DN66973_c6_g6~~TRINITY_DN66973_c6_g6_i1.p1  ORF type:complete len:419 (-),score=192.00 TRINITY_DN66973_c6_g6_i1:72-1262(-)